MIARPYLSDADIRRLVKGADADERAAAAHKLCKAVEARAVSADERAAAEGVIRVLAADAAELVRRALAVTLRTSDLIPHDVALRLARDVDAVALPIISGSPVLTDEDLVEIVRHGTAVGQLAVAQRETLSKPVTCALSVFAAEEALAAACANDNAVFAEASLHRAIDRFPHSDAVKGAIAYRKVVPLALAERLISLVSEAVRRHLVEHHDLKVETALKLSRAARERATVDLLDQAAVAGDFAGLAAQLNRCGRLNASMLLRAAARGQIEFLEHGLAELAGVAHERTWLMVHDAGPLGFRAIYERAGLPARLFASFRAALEAWRSVRAEDLSPDRETLQARVLERFLTSQPFASREDIDYLMEKLDRAPQARPVAHANAA